MSWTTLPLPLLSEVTPPPEPDRKPQPSPAALGCRPGDIRREPESTPKRGRSIVDRRSPWWWPAPMAFDHDVAQGPAAQGSLEQVAILLLGGRPLVVAASAAPPRASVGSYPTHGTPQALQGPEGMMVTSRPRSPRASRGGGQRRGPGPQRHPGPAWVAILPGTAQAPREAVRPRASAAPQVAILLGASAQGGRPRGGAGRSTLRPYAMLVAMLLDLDGGPPPWPDLRGGKRGPRGADCSGRGQS